MKRYRYVMVGSFIPQNGQHLADGDVLHAIDIPSPYLYNSIELAKENDCFLEFRFGVQDGIVGICVFDNVDGYHVLKNKRGQRFYIPCADEKHIVSFMNYQMFKNLGGMVYNIPKEITCNIDPLISDENFHLFEEWVKASHKFQWNQKDYEINATFDDLFPYLQENSPPVYIDNEAYDILTVET